jgi:lipopolysaccharide/colanic/teichoic acid biosynthesis glycosyltransferase
MGKRCFDIFGSLTLFIIFFPLMVLIALAVVIMSGRPIFFKQERAGYRRKTFFIYKFRTMVNGSDNGVSVVSERDARITRVGKYLRKTHLDELPQLWNVLRGEMSLVGPRPLPLHFDDALLMQKSHCFKERFEVRPGMTGQMQIRRRKWVIENIVAVVVLEAEYVRRQSFLLDLKILFVTIFVVLKGQGM